jgi:uncharacterized membrane protein YkvA (DUF1232 family)
MADPAELVKYLDVFPEWLRTLGEDAAALGEVAKDVPDGDVGRYVVAGINYVFKSLDLIADGIDDVGFCDDAFVIRVASSLAIEADPSANQGIIARLAADAKQVEEFLEEDYEALVEYTKGLRKGAARGRTVDEILGEPTIRQTFVQEVAQWAEEYKVPSFTRDVKTLIKLKAFLSANLA